MKQKPNKMIKMNSIEKTIKNKHGETIIVQMSWLSGVGVIFIKKPSTMDEFIPINDYLANTITSYDEDLSVIKAIREIKEQIANIVTGILNDL